MKKLLKAFLLINALLILCIFAFIVFRIVYYFVDISSFRLHEYQIIELDYGKRIQIYNNNLDDATSFYLTIEENQKFLIKDKFFWITFDPFSSFSVIHSPAYEVIGITKHGRSPNKVIALFDFESKEFWAADNDDYNDEELGQKLLTKFLSYPQEPFVLYGSEQ